MRSTGFDKINLLYENSGTIVQEISKLVVGGGKLRIEGGGKPGIVKGGKRMML